MTQPTPNSSTTTEFSKIIMEYVEVPELLRGVHITYGDAEPLETWKMNFVSELTIGYGRFDFKVTAEWTDENSQKHSKLLIMGYKEAFGFKLCRQINQFLADFIYFANACTICPEDYITI